MENFLRAILSSLNCLEVKGKDNLDILLGCLIAIENAISEMEQSEAQEEEKGVVDNG